MFCQFVIVFFFFVLAIVVLSLLDVRDVYERAPSLVSGQITSTRWNSVSGPTLAYEGISRTMKRK